MVVQMNLSRGPPIRDSDEMLLIFSRLYIQAGIENFWQRHEQVFFPVLGLAHVNPIFRSDFIGRPLTLDSFQGNFRFEPFAVPITLHL